MPRIVEEYLVPHFRIAEQLRPANNSRDDIGLQLIEREDQIISYGVEVPMF